MADKKCKPGDARNNENWEFQKNCLFCHLDMTIDFETLLTFSELRSLYSIEQLRMSKTGEIFEIISIIFEFFS